ncbi:hypothetical protein [Desulfovibrio sp. 86]|uniref:Glycosyltransferase RgtA/B/C/D-like domain-containing protein n=1 Tax=uncultured Desulfovibrio sp. TaxID=167968 RepID=A0A212L8E1_9BACT|nr:hypothetical protein [Desulfovibrio sp. 86]SCM73842.1 membrane hypothetical protein [uncultured Desulfovibrio sp.]VZH34459.1 conserved membrane protein of unknown function [Desulfovibrio sp. 86]
MSAKPAARDASRANLMDRPSVSLLCVFLFCVSLLILGYSVLYRPLNRDEYEHLYSSYLMVQGQLPYRDFFQHHHFLSWLLLAPVVKIFSDTPYLLYIARCLSLCAILATAFYTYKISVLKGGDKRSVFLFVTVLLSIDIIVWSGILVRPDMFMVAAFFAGLYYYIIYLKYKNIFPLVLSFLLFFASFLFLQKAIFLLFGFGICAIYHLYKKELRLRDFLTALALPLFLLAYLLYFMLKEHVLIDYVELNWLFNFMIPFEYGKILVKPPLLFCSIALIMAETGIIKRAKFQFTSVIFLVFCVFFAILPTPYWQYYIPLFPFIIMTLSSSFSIVQDRKNKNAIVVLLLLLVIFNAGLNIYKFVWVKTNTCVKREYDIVLRVTGENEEILGSHEICPVRRDALGYYGHILELCQLENAHFSRGKELYDIPELIMTKAPKVLWSGLVEEYFDDNGFKTYIEQNYVKICRLYVARSIPPEKYQNDRAR